jgi:hypothetical protein
MLIPDAHPMILLWVLQPRLQLQTEKFLMGQLLQHLSPTSLESLV